MAYQVEFAPRAARQFRDLPKDVQKRLKVRIDALADNPRPQGVERLAGPEELYRIRAGEYRVIYVIRDQVMLVLVVGVGHRRDIYRRLLR